MTAAKPPPTASAHAHVPREHGRDVLGEHLESLAGDVEVVGADHPVDEVESELRAIRVVDQLGETQRAGGSAASTGSERTPDGLVSTRSIVLGVTVPGVASAPRRWVVLRRRAAGEPPPHEGHRLLGQRP